MKNIIIVLCAMFGIFFSGISEIKGQESTSKNTFYLELFGNGLLYSANYDYRTSEKFGIRAGIGYVGSIKSGILSVPVLGNFMLGKDGKYFEVGGGLTYIKSSSDLFDYELSSIIGTLSFAYRSQPVNGGVMWKLGLTPIIDFKEVRISPYWVALGVGYCW
ncbi:MAG: hypothetical protein LC107_08675 [Chitinophagales bacterium]|nr:hypothetical protein [Chitinophagales bacterium]